MKPRLSVIAMSYNRPAGLRRAINSVVRQTFDAWELLVVDDQSTDPAVVEVYVEARRRYGGRIFWVDLDVDPYPARYRQRVLTLGRNLNAAIEIARGEFICYIGDGVEYMGDRCRRLVACLDREPSWSVVWDHQSVERYDADGELVDRTMPRDEFVARAFPGRVLADQLATGNCIDHNSVVERTSVARAYPWTEDPAHWRDLDWQRWRRMADDGVGFAFLPVVGEIKRTGPDNLGVMLAHGSSIDEVVARRNGGRDGRAN